MTIGREAAIQLATQFANANGYRVVPTFDGVEWARAPLPVKLRRAHLADGEWIVGFEMMLHPEVAIQDPSSFPVTVDPETGACEMPSCP